MAFAMAVHTNADVNEILFFAFFCRSQSKHAARFSNARFQIGFPFII